MNIATRLTMFMVRLRFNIKVMMIAPGYIGRKIREELWILLRSK